MKKNLNIKEYEHYKLHKKLIDKNEMNDDIDLKFLYYYDEKKELLLYICVNCLCEEMQGKKSIKSEISSRSIHSDNLKEYDMIGENKHAKRHNNDFAIVKQLDHHYYCTYCGDVRKIDFDNSEIKKDYDKKANEIINKIGVIENV